MLPAIGTTRALGHRGSYGWGGEIAKGYLLEHLHSGTASKLASGHQDGQAFSLIDNLTVVFSSFMARSKMPAIS